MSFRKFPSVLALLLLCLVAVQSASAQTSGPSSNGTYQFSFDDKYAKFVDFSAQTLSDGSTSGSMFYSDEATLQMQDVDGTGDKNLQLRYPGFSIKVAFDDMNVNNNQAVMSGTVSDSDVPDFIGQRVLLTVEDNGDGTRVPDKLTWGLYQVPGEWAVSDAELKDDPGVGLRWLATDAERPDDKGIVMPLPKTTNAQTFPISSYDFATVASGAGDIVVKP